MSSQLCFQYPVTISMASHPPRRAGMLKRVTELLPQCDRLRLYLNNYSDDILSELPVSPKLDVILAGNGRKHKDMGSQGKFYGVGCDRNGVPDDSYWLTCDDDIFYPGDYVQYMVDGCVKYGNKCIVTIHGGIYMDINNGMLNSLPVRDMRVLHRYDRARSEDMPVHTAGCGIFCCHPKTIGLDDSCITGELHSGDDEDIAVWSQKMEVPIIRLAGRHGWVLADDSTHGIQPLYGNTMSVCLADEKIRKWKNWHYPKMPLFAMKKEEKMFNIALTQEQKDICNKMLSTDALTAFIVDALITRKPVSVIRMSDGERALMALSEGESPEYFLLDQTWLKRYGLADADLSCVGRRLIQAGREATYLANTISGIYLRNFDCFKWFPERKQIVSSFFAYEMAAAGRVRSILEACGGVIVLHHDAERLAPLLAHKYRVEARGYRLASWKDQSWIAKEVRTCPHNLVLVSGGASGKPFCVDLAKDTGKVVLDVGAGLGDSWL